MRGERISEARLKEGGASAASAVFQDVCTLLNIPEAERSAAARNIKVRCVYKGTTVPDAPLHSQQAVTYEWFVGEHGPFEYKTNVNRTVDAPSLHHLPTSMIGLSHVHDIWLSPSIGFCTARQLTRKCMHLDR